MTVKPGAQPFGNPPPPVRPWPGVRHVTRKIAANYSAKSHFPHAAGSPGDTGPPVKPISVPSVRRARNWTKIMKTV